MPVYGSYGTKTVPLGNGPVSSCLLGNGGMGKQCQMSIMLCHEAHHHHREFKKIIIQNY